MSSKEDNFKEQFRQALISTAKVISEDYKLDVKKLDKDLSNKKTGFFDVTNLNFLFSSIKLMLLNFHLQLHFVRVLLVFFYF